MVGWLREKQNLMVVDLSSIAFRFYKNPEGMISGLYDMIVGFGVSYDAKDIVVCCDYGDSKYRLNLLPEYKSNRKAKAEQRTEQEKADIEFYYDCQNEAIKNLESKGIIVIQEYGVEADDHIGYVVNHYSNKYPHTWIISADKDFNALISETVSQYSTSQAKTMDLEYLKTELDCDPATFLRALIISGDSIDGIPGYYLIGEPKKPSSRSLKYAAVGKTYDEIAYWVNKKQKKGKIDQYFLDHPEIYERNKLLIELHDDVLTLEQKTRIKEKMNESVC